MIGWPTGTGESFPLLSGINLAATPADGSRLLSTFANSIASPLPMEEATHQISKSSRKESLPSTNAIPTSVVVLRMVIVSPELRETELEQVECFKRFMTSEDARRKLHCCKRCCSSLLRFLAAGVSVTGTDSSLVIPSR